VAGSHGYGHFWISTAGVWIYATDTAHNEFVGGTTYTDTLSVSSADGTSHLLTVNILGTNDPAVIGGTDTQNLTETNAVLTTGGTLTISDVDSAATFAAQTDVAGSHGYGHFSINSAGAWTYATDTAHNEFVGGRTYTDMLSVSSADGTSHLLTVNILGTNDPAVIAGTDTQNLTETNGVLTTGGTLTISDIDSAASFAARTNVAGSHGYGHFSISSSGVWTYATDTAHNEFVAGTTYTDTLSVSSADGTSHLLTVNILGANDPAVIAGQTIGAVEVADDGPGSGTLTYTGTLTDTDVDNAANTFATAAAGSATDHGYGTYQMTAAGVWTYTLNNSNAAVQALGENQHLTDTFTVHTVDGTAQIITVNVTDNDDPDHDVYAADGITLLSTSTAFMSGNSHNFIGGSTGDTIIGHNDSTVDRINAQGGNDTIYGRGGNDIIQGGDGNDVIYAGSGNDTITGGAGADQLWGGSGGDTFVFAAVADSTPASFDTIQDFQVGVDHIKLSGLGFSATTSGFGALAAHSVNWSQVGSDTVVLGDTNGGPGNAELQIVLKGVTATSLHLSDFILA
jgi:VCBS repeat-containing protein